MPRTALTPAVLTPDSGAANLTTAAAGTTTGAGTGNGVSFSQPLSVPLLLLVTAAAVSLTATVNIGATVLGQPVTPFTVDLPVNLLAAPAAPTLAQATTGGTVTAGTYGVIITYVNAAGETTGSTAATVTTTGSASTITINSPVPEDTATGWYAYMTQAGGSTYTRQQTAGSPTPVGTNLVISAPPASTGANPPTTNTAAVPTVSALGPYMSQVAQPVTGDVLIDFSAAVTCGLIQVPGTY